MFNQGAVVSDNVVHWLVVRILISNYNIVCCSIALIALLNYITEALQNWQRCCVCVTYNRIGTSSTSLLREWSCYGSLGVTFYYVDAQVYSQRKFVRNKIQNKHGLIQWIVGTLVNIYVMEKLFRGSLGLLVCPKHFIVLFRPAGQLTIVFNYFMVEIWIGRPFLSCSVVSYGRWTLKLF